MDSASLDGQVVLVTGASSGIGQAVARTLDAAGAHVVLMARREAELQALVAELSPRASYRCGDVSSEAEVAAVVEHALSAHGRIDGLVNNAGVGSFARVVDTEPADLHLMFDVNVRGTFLCARAVLPGMLERGSGWVVNVCSDVSRRVFAGGGAYCASKHAQYALSLAMGAECRPHGVRVGAVLPGIVGTEFTGGKPEERASWVLRPEDVADAVLFMATRPEYAVVDELTLHPVQQEY